MKKRLLYVICMQSFSAVKPKHVVGIDYEISKRSQKSMPDELYRRRKTSAFRPGQAFDVPLKGTIDFPGGRGPLDVSAGGRPGYPVFSQQEV
jgi:hypothetical protein